MGSSGFYSGKATDYKVVDKGNDGSGFYDGPAYTEIDPVAINNSLAEAAASAAASEASKVASGVSAASSASSASAALASQNAASASATAADASHNSAVAQQLLRPHRLPSPPHRPVTLLRALLHIGREGHADTSEANAAANAAAALVSEGNADTSESNAATSETNAAASAAAALVRRPTRPRLSRLC